MTKDCVFLVSTFANKFGSCSFAVAVQFEWNTLPPVVRLQTKRGLSGGLRSLGALFSIRFEAFLIDVTSFRIQNTDYSAEFDNVK